MKSLAGSMMIKNPMTTINHNIKWSPTPPILLQMDKKINIRNQMPII